jgi:hypothetical protein
MVFMRNKMVLVAHPSFFSSSNRVNTRLLARKLENTP